MDLKMTELVEWEDSHIKTVIINIENVPKDLNTIMSGIRKEGNV